MTANDESNDQPSVQMQPLRLPGSDMALLVTRFMGRRTLRGLYGAHAGTVVTPWAMTDDGAALRREARFCVGRVLGFPIRAASEQSLDLALTEDGEREYVRVRAVARVSGAPFCAPLRMCSEFRFTPEQGRGVAMRSLTVGGGVRLERRDVLKQKKKTKTVVKDKEKTKAKATTTVDKGVQADEASRAVGDEPHGQQAEEKKKGSDAEEEEHDEKAMEAVKAVGGLLGRIFKSRTARKLDEQRQAMIRRSMEHAPSPAAPVEAVRRHGEEDDEEDCYACDDGYTTNNNEDDEAAEEAKELRTLAALLPKLHRPPQQHRTTMPAQAQKQQPPRSTTATTKAPVEVGA